MSAFSVNKPLPRAYITVHDVATQRERGLLGMIRCGLIELGESKNPLVRIYACAMIAFSNRMISADVGKGKPSERTIGKHKRVGKGTVDRTGENGRSKKNKRKSSLQK